MVLAVAISSTSVSWFAALCCAHLCVLLQDDSVCFVRDEFQTRAEEVALEVWHQLELFHARYGFSLRQAGPLRAPWLSACRSLLRYVHSMLTVPTHQR